MTPFYGILELEKYSDRKWISGCLELENTDLTTVEPQVMKIFIALVVTWEYMLLVFIKLYT